MSPNFSIKMVQFWYPCGPCGFVLAALLQSIIVLEVTAFENTEVPPKVHLGSYELGYRWENLTETLPETYSEFVEVEGNDFSVVSRNVSGIILACEAPYPICWEIVDVQPDWFRYIDIHTKAIYDEIGMEFVLKEFKTYLELSNEPSASGTYRCRSASEFPVRETLIYVFLNGRSSYYERAFSFPLKHITIGLSNDDDVLVIPCKISNKNYNVSLSRPAEANNATSSESDEWLPVSMNYTFDPRKGFIIQNPSPISDYLGDFMCSNAEDEDDYLKVKVEKDYTVNTKFQYRYLRSGDDAFVVSKPYRVIASRIVCCSNGTKKPSTHGIECKNKAHCEIIKALIGQNDIINVYNYGNLFTHTAHHPRNKSQYSCGSTYVDTEPVIFRCDGDGIDFSGEFINEFLPHSDIKTKFVSNFKNDSLQPHNSVRLVALRLELRRSRFDPDYMTEVPVYINLNKEKIYRGDKVVFYCCGLPYHHVFGKIQRIVWKNGTTSGTGYSPDNHRSDVRSELYEIDSCSPINLLYNDDSIIASLDMRYFECMVPLWNRAEPVVKRIELKVGVLAEPEWVIDNNHTITNVTFEDNQVGVLRLDCSLRFGDPFPEMTWWKNGYKVNLTDKYHFMVFDNNKSNLRVFGTGLMFLRAVKEIQGEYVCQAKNRVGSLEKRFFVTVNGRSYIDYWISLCVFGGFFAVVIICAIRISSLDKPPASFKGASGSSNKHL